MPPCIWWDDHERRGEGVVYQRCPMGGPRGDARWLVVRGAGRRELIYAARCIGEECAARLMRETGAAGALLMLALVGGFVLLAITVLLAEVLPRWATVLLVVGYLAMLGFNDQTARALLAIPNGVAWSAVGYVLWSGEAVQQPARGIIRCGSWRAKNSLPF
jgi:hypothetical protein